jgi:RimJ/RimL family protein N-acetyltransferase
MAMETVYLRALELDDLERTYKWHNDPELYRTLGGQFHYVSRATEEEWLRKKQAYSPQEVNLAICLTSTQQHIGNFYIREIDWIARHASLHVLIGETIQRGKGYGTVANHLVVKYAFQNLGLNRLWVSVLEDNQPSLKLFEKCGFTVEGKLRKHAFKDGQFKDVILLGICAGDLPSKSN